MNLGKSTAPPYKEHTLSIPQDWHSLAADVMTAAIAIDESLTDLRLQPVNVCVVNHYTSSSKLGWHEGALCMISPACTALSSIISYMSLNL
jgi:hypothetical protein